MAFELPQKKVKVKPNFENAGWIKNKRHAAFFKVEGAYESYPVAMTRNGSLKNPFTDEEKKYLEEVLGYEQNALSVYKKDGPLREINVRLTKDPLELDLSNPEDFIKYKVLLTNSDRIAPSVKDIKAKGTYKFYIEDAEEVAEITKLKGSIEQKAWIEYGKISENKNRLIAFLKVYNQVKKLPAMKIDKDSKLDFLQAKVMDAISLNKQDFIDIITNPDFDIMLTIAEGVETGVLKKSGTKYSLAEGDQIGDTLKHAINYLKAPVNQELRLIVEEQIKLKS